MAYAYEVVDYPNLPSGQGTWPTGINNSGQIVGYFSPGPGITVRGFSDMNGNFTGLLSPYGPAAFALGVNNHGQIAGYGSGPGSREQAFVYQNGSFSQAVVPGSIRSEAHGMNDRGEIVGRYWDSSGTAHGFLDDNGRFFPEVAVRGTDSTTPEDINNNGQIVGSYTEGGLTHGFIEIPRGLISIDVPGAASTEALGVDGFGRVVGDYADNGGHTHGFLDVNGHFATLDVPGAASTTAADINDLGEIVGSYTDPSGTHGFLAANIMASAIGHRQPLRDLLPAWAENRAAQAHAAGWAEQHPTAAALSGALLTHEVGTPYALHTGQPSPAL